MATKSIGTSSRDYSTVQAWEDSLIAVLIAEEIGECYNDSEFSVAGSVVTFAGSTAALSTDIILRAAAGQGFRAGVATNPPRYNQANGVAFNRTAAYGTTVVISEDFVTLQNIQMTHTGGGTVLDVSGGYSNTIVKDTLSELPTGSAGVAVWVRFRAGNAWNNLIVQRGATNGNGVSFDYAGTITLINMTVVRVSDSAAGGQACGGSGGTIAVKNCQFFGWSTIQSSGITYTTCHTDIASPPSGCTQVTYTNQFTTTTDATRDFRTKAGADSIGAGTVDSTSLPDADDIVGTARGAAWDIGWFEYVAAAAAGNSDSYIIQFN